MSKLKYSDIVQGGQGRTSNETVHDSLIVLLAIIIAGATAIAATLKYSRTGDAPTANHTADVSKMVNK